MTTLSPTLSQQRWGQEPHQIFDFLANPQRDPDGNALLIYRVGGGGASGDYRSIWDSANGEEFFFMKYLNTNTTLTTHFDILTVQTAQRNLTGPSIRSHKVSVLDAAIELQFAIAELKRLGALGFGPTNSYLIDPNRVCLWGSSWGATIGMLSQLMPPYIGSGSQKTNLFRTYVGGGYSSQVRAIVNHIGQIDVRRISGVEQMDSTVVGGWFGTRTDDSGVEWAAFPNTVKAAASPLAYVQNGDTQFYRPIYNLYYDGGGGGGDHVHPYHDAHDSAQRTTMVTALNARHLTCGSRQYTPGDLNSETTPHAASVLHGEIYNWLVNRLASTSVITPLPVL